MSEESLGMDCKNDELPIEHSREDELNVIIIGLQGKIDKLKREKQEVISEIVRKLKDLPRETIVWDDMPGGKAHKQKDNIEFGKTTSYVVHHRDLNILIEEFGAKIK